MRSLKPKETTANAISVKAAADLQNEITGLQEQISALRSSIDEIADTLNTPNVGRGDATFGTLQSTDLNVSRNTTLQNAGISDLTADKIETPDIEAVNATVTNVLDANQINTPKLNADEVKTDSLQSDEVQTDTLTTDSVTTTTVTADTATLGTANISTANISNYSTNKVTAVEVESTSLNTDEVTTESAEVTDLTSENAEIENAEIAKARIENRYYISDLPGKTIQLTQVEEQHPAWICLDTRGLQNAKIIAKDLTGELFSVIYSNTRHTPLIQWSKRNEKSLQRFFYNYKTNKLYLETWASCEFQWQIDGYEETPFIPQTFQDDFPDNLLDCYKYNVSRKHGIVLMGEQGADTVLSVQGAIEGSFLVDEGEFVYLDFYSDSVWDLFNAAKSFLRSGSDEDGWQYEKAQCWGYVKHAEDSTVMDADNTEIEALEKIEYVDENTIKLTIDNQYGQDEITISSEDLQEDETLPFVLGFTVRTPKIDYAFNREAKTLSEKVDNSYYGG